MVSKFQFINFKHVHDIMKNYYDSRCYQTSLNQIIQKSEGNTPDPGLRKAKPKYNVDFSNLTFVGGNEEEKNDIEECLGKNPITYQHWQHLKK